MKKENLQEINMGLQDETKEHGSWATPAQIRKIVMDHLRIDSQYYSKETEEENPEEHPEENSENTEDTKY